MKNRTHNDDDAQLALRDVMCCKPSAQWTKSSFTKT